MKPDSVRMLFILAVLSLVLFADCADSTDPEDKSTVFYQVPGCLNKQSRPDSCFSYTFFETLKVDFCVNGNCCPDSNRFVFSQKISADTINVTITDVEEKLCRCICTYRLHYESDELTLPEYLFNVYLSDSTGNLLLYSQKVSVMEG